MNPYEADPAKIPASDSYADIPQHGRYLPTPTDFTPDTTHAHSTSADSLQYWESVLSQCTASNRIYENETGGRDVFALGAAIVKSSHLKAAASRDYALADANEVQATNMAAPKLHEISVRVPQIYFAGRVKSLLSFQNRDLRMLTIYTDPRQKRPGAGDDSGCRAQRSMAVPLPRRKRRLQITSARYPAEPQQGQPAQGRPCTAVLHRARPGPCDQPRHPKARARHSARAAAHARGRRPSARGTTAGILPQRRDEVEHHRRSRSDRGAGGLGAGGLLPLGGRAGDALAGKEPAGGVVCALAPGGGCVGGLVFWNDLYDSRYGPIAASFSVRGRVC